MQAPHYRADFDWDVNVIQSDQANAFCLPGGKMAVYTGLIPVAQNDDAMAVVMGHEIAHALLRHGAQRMAQQKLAQMGQMAGAMSGMDPQQQQAVMAVDAATAACCRTRASTRPQADEVGLMLAAAACFNPQEAIPLWQRMSAGERRSRRRPSSHRRIPNPGTRIQNLQALMPKAMEYRAKFCARRAAAPARRQDRPLATAVINAKSRLRPASLSSVLKSGRELCFCRWCTHATEPLRSS